MDVPEALLPGCIAAAAEGCQPMTATLGALRLTRFRPVETVARWPLVTHP
jgi:hypothetical protein